MDGQALFSRFRLTLCVLLSAKSCVSGKMGIEANMIDSLQVEESQHTGKISLGLSVIVRVTLKDGTYHEVCTDFLS